MIESDRRGWPFHLGYCSKDVSNPDPKPCYNPTIVGAPKLYLYSHNILDSKLISERSFYNSESSLTYGHLDHRSKGDSFSIG